MGRLRQGSKQPAWCKTPGKWLHGGYMNSEKKKDLEHFCAKSLILLGWLMGLEPTTTGITILDSTN